MKLGIIAYGADRRIHIVNMQIRGTAATITQKRLERVWAEMQEKHKHMLDWSLVGAVHHVPTSGIVWLEPAEGKLKLEVTR